MQEAVHAREDDLDILPETPGNTWRGHDCGHVAAQCADGETYGGERRVLP